MFHLLKRKNNSWGDYWIVLTDYRAVLMMCHYSACFGTELVMLNQLVIHFTDYFDLSLLTAGLFAFIFGATNIFARSLGGYASDRFARSYGLTGRLWVQFLHCYAQVWLYLLWFNHKRNRLAICSCIFICILYICTNGRRSMFWCSTIYQ
eukprot:UN32938